MTLHHEVADTTTIKVFNIAVTVITGRLQGKKQGFLRETKGTAICQQPSYLSIGSTDSAGANERRYFFYGIIHSAKVRLSEHKTKEFILFFVEREYFRLIYKAKLLYFLRNSDSFNIVLSMKA